MGWQTDKGGLALKAQEVKLYAPGSTWGMRLSQLKRQRGRVSIVTFSLPSPTYIEVQLGRRPHSIALVCHEKFETRAMAIQARYPGIEIRLHPEIHGKLLLIEPETVYVGSSNFGESGWVEFTVGIRSSEAYDFYHRQFVQLFQAGFRTRGSHAWG